MSERVLRPICPACGYDLSGILEPESLIPCPECGRRLSYQRAIEPPKQPQTTRNALLFILAIPSAWMGIFWFQLNIANSLQGALVPYFSGLILTLYLPTLAGILLTRDWLKRRRTNPGYNDPHYIKAVLIVFACLIIAMGWNWIVFMQWVEGVANV